MQYKILNKIEAFLNEQKDHISLWYAFVYINSILLYFILAQEPSLSLLCIACLLSLILCIIALIKSSSLAAKFFSNIIFIFFLGLLVATFNSYRLKPVAIKEKIKQINVEGVIVKIKPTPYGSQINLDKVKIENFEPNSTPDVVRLNFSKFAAKHLLIGDRIKVLADLSPPPTQVVPHGYDFKLIAFFNKIGAVGSAKSEPEIINYSGADFSYTILNLRKKIHNLLIAKLGNKNGNFAAALFLGEIGGIDQTTLKNMRFAGISHILCVSGLHLSLVAAIFFMASRFFLNMFDYLAFRYDIKKIAGYISLVASFCYLLLTGMQIAATRAFIMTSVAIWAILIARQPYPMRSLAIASIVIISLNPEYVIHPSFQLSFIAVISLLVGYEFYISSSKILGNSKGIFASIRLYIYSNIYSSIIASLATAPIVIYHFYIYSSYSVIANLVAVPMVSFISMPIGILALILSFCSLSSLPFYILSISIDIIRKVASFTVSLPYSVIYCGNMENYQIMIFIISFFWLGIWKNNIRWFGIGGIFLSLIIFFFTPRPDVLINPQIPFVAINQNGKIIIYGDKLSPFTKNFVANWFGYEKALVKKFNLKEQRICLNIDYQADNCPNELDLANNYIKLGENIIKANKLTSIYYQNGIYKINQFDNKRFLFR